VSTGALPAFTTLAWHLNDSDEELQMQRGEPGGQSRWRTAKRGKGEGHLSDAE